MIVLRNARMKENAMWDLSLECKTVNAFNKALVPCNYMLDLGFASTGTSKNQMSGLSFAGTSKNQNHIWLILMKINAGSNVKVHTYNADMYADIDPISYCPQRPESYELFNVNFHMNVNSIDTSASIKYWANIHNMLYTCEVCNLYGSTDDSFIRESIFDVMKCHNEATYGINPFYASCLDEFFIKMDLLGIDVDFLHKFKA